MTQAVSAVAAQLERQVFHWSLAARRLRLDDLVAPEAWGLLEKYLGVSLRQHLQRVIDRLGREADALVALKRSAESPTALGQVHRQLLIFRHRYLRTETTLDFFADAVNTRTNARTGALLRACDTLAYRSIAALLDPLGMTTPCVLTYLDSGIGASILKAGLRLWDSDFSPVAAVKIVRHNLLRPTALIHEAGHQAAHLTGWNEELAEVLARGLAGQSTELAQVWSSWASEIAADAFAFVHTGYASVSALHDVVAGDPASVFRFTSGDPHPVSYLRVLLGVEACRRFYGDGPWDALALAWRSLHSTRHLPEDVRALLTGSVPLLRDVVQLTLDTPMRSFRGRSLAGVLQPEHVSPKALSELERRLGDALFTSAHWLWTEPLRILALTGLRLAQRPENLTEILDQQEQSMLRLGGALQAA